MSLKNYKKVIHTNCSAIAISFLAFLILLSSLLPAIYYTDYLINQKKITELFCINKSRPELNCCGKCHLKKELAETGDNQPKVPKQQKERLEVILFLTLVNSLDFKSYTNRSEWKFPISFYKSKSGKSLFRPPVNDSNIS